MPENKFKILIVEDDANLGILLLEYLENQGFTVQLCRDGTLALKAFQISGFDICLLDIMLPGMDGFSVAKGIRITDKNIPLIFLTARSLKEDKLKGYTLGADDYILKPFDEEELLWKINALLRRKTENKTGNEPDIISIGNYLFDPARQSLSIENRSRRITEKESRILKYLCANRNKLIKRDEILSNLWGENDYFLGRSLDVFITKIRKYLKEDPSINIENVFGVGFIFNVPG